MLNVTFSRDIYRRLDFGINISHEASGRRPRAKRVYNLVAREARMRQVNRAWYWPDAKFDAP